MPLSSLDEGLDEGNKFLKNTFHFYDDSSEEMTE